MQRYLNRKEENKTSVISLISHLESEIWHHMVLRTPQYAEQYFARNSALTKDVLYIWKISGFYRYEETPSCIIVCLRERLSDFRDGCAPHQVRKYLYVQGLIQVTEISTLTRSPFTENQKAKLLSQVDPFLLFSFLRHHGLLVYYSNTVFTSFLFTVLPLFLSHLTLWPDVWRIWTTLSYEVKLIGAAYKPTIIESPTKTKISSANHLTLLHRKH